MLTRSGQYYPRERDITRYGNIIKYSVVLRPCEGHLRVFQTFIWTLAAFSLILSPVLARDHFHRNVLGAFLVFLSAGPLNTDL